MLTLKTTAKFRKDYKLAKKRGLDLHLLQSVIDDLLEEKLIQHQPLLCLKIRVLKVVKQ